MAYRVQLLPQARIQLFKAVAWWAEHRSTEQAGKWLDRFEAALSELAKDPERWPLATENGEVAGELREMHFGIGRSKTHRAIFGIRNNKVVVYAVRHLAQDNLTAEDFQ